MHGIQIPGLAYDRYVYLMTVAWKASSLMCWFQGKNSAMGVFVWPTNSHINEITGGFPVDSLALNDSNIMVLDDISTS